MIKNFKTLLIDKLVKADWNYKTDNDELKQKLITNLKRNGQLENIVVRQLETGFYEIVNGNHRYDALKELGIEKVIVYDLGKISQQQAIRIAIELNETRFETDNMKLAERIKELAAEFNLEDLSASMPFTEEELENYAKLLDFDWNQFKNNPNEDGTEENQEELFDITFTLNEEQLQRWNDLKKRLKKDDSAAFDFAVQFTLNNNE